MSRSLALVALIACMAAPIAHAAPDATVLAEAVQQKAPFLDTLKDLVSIESGSRDREGLDRISDLIAARLRALGGKVELIEPSANTYRMSDTPEKLAAWYTRASRARAQKNF